MAEKDSAVPVAETSEVPYAMVGRGLDPPAAASAFAPNLELGDQKLILSWLEKSRAEDGSIENRLRFSTLQSREWSAPVTIAEGPNFFANWADFPKVIEAAEGTLFAHWLAKTAEDTYAYSVNLARSDDGGITWNSLGILNDDSTPTEHGFVSYVRERTGIRAFWLDGRATLQEGGSMSLRTAYVNETVERSELLDDRVCDCCSTDAAIVAGRPAVVFRDRSANEIRDISIIRSVTSRLGGRSDSESEGTGGSEWSDSTPVSADGWEIAGCPVNGPEMAAHGDLTAVAWFTASGDQPQVAVTFSSNGGVDFGAPLVIDAAGPLGRVDVVMDGADGAVVSWLAAGDDKAEVSLQRVSVDGRISTPLVVARTSASRAAGVPRLVRFGELLYIAWVETGNAAGSRLRVREIELSSLTLGEPRSS